MSAKFEDGSLAYLKWAGVAHIPFEVTIFAGQVQGRLVNAETGELTNAKTGSIDGWLIPKASQ